MRYADVSDANLYYGNMRFDVNVSVSKTSELGKRTETKNLNSFRSVERAAEYEVERQIGLLEQGERIVQETRGWDDAGQKPLANAAKKTATNTATCPTQTSRPWFSATNTWPMSPRPCPNYPMPTEQSSAPWDSMPKRLKMS